MRRKRGPRNGVTTVTHDALGRTLVVTDGGGGTLTNTYTNQDVLTVLGPAPAGEVVKQVQKEYNGLGQLLSACQLSSATGTTSCGQANGGTGYLTTYNYNADGTVASVVRMSQTHSFTYDALGRTLTATYPESGTKQFFYDSAPSTPGVACSTLALLTDASPLGNLLKTYDANGTTICYSYDSMNRVTSIAYSGTNWDGDNKYFTYDSATVDSATMANTLGRLAEAYTAPTASGTKVTDEGFSYTARGQVSDVYQWSTHSNGYYHTTATYFANHALNTLRGVPGASGSPWTYSLDGKGRPYSAIQGASTNMVSRVTYNAADEPCVVTLGLGDTDTYNYDNNTTCASLLSTGRMTSYAFSIGATPVTTTGTYSWNPNGTLNGLKVVDGINAANTETCTYGTSSNRGYDEFGNLVSAVCANSGGTNVWGQAFTYDMYNNVTKSVPAGDTGISWMPGYNATNNQYTLAGTTYDSNGNLLTDTFHTYTWNQDNHLKAITDTTTTMTYDAFGRMVEKYNGSSYNQELISPVGEVAWMAEQNLVQFRMPLPGGDTAVTGINFQHRDRLGSVTLESTRGNRASAIDRAFAPYGKEYNNIGLTTHVNFTGDNQDLVAGTFDTPNRELNPSQGRWLSPDPARAGWNPYAYGTNPNSQIDPSGLMCDFYCDIPGAGVDYEGGWATGGIAPNPGSLIFTMDGMDTPGSLIMAAINGGGAVGCPNNNCGIGTLWPYECGGLGCNYMTIEYLATHENQGWNGTWYTDEEWKEFLDDSVDFQKQVNADMISLKSNSPDGSNWDTIYNHLKYVGTQGGNAEFQWTDIIDPDDPNEKPVYLADEGIDINDINNGGCEWSCRTGSMPSLHYHNYEFHVDTANVTWGFGLGLFIHGFVDFFLQNINSGVPVVYYYPGIPY